MFGPEYYKSELPVDQRINAKGEVDKERTQAVHVAPGHQSFIDSETTVEDEFQAALWRSRITPAPVKKDDGLRGFIAKFDKEAQARAAGKGNQKFDEFDGPMPTRDPNLDALIKKYGKGDNNNSRETVLRVGEPVAIDPAQPIH